VGGRADVSGNDRATSAGMVQVKVDSAFQSPFLSAKLETLGIQIVNTDAKWTLTRSKDANWLLLDSQKRKLEIDFDLNRADYQRAHKGSGELIARALGIKDGIKKVVDLTAGLGIDAVFLAQIGFSVISIERNPLMIFLLQEAQNKTKRLDVKNIQWVMADSRLYLNDYKINEPTSCYFDPMYPEKKKSALPRQEMVIFREIVGADDDAASVLQFAVQKGFSRTAVKRPVKAETVLQGPDFQLTSKLVRYDVYYPRPRLEVKTK
jgi:16S rRNA (guanine1516-N2)-methyltransferase